MKVAILVIEGSTAMGIFGAMDVLLKANETDLDIQGLSGKELFTPVFVSQGEKVVKSSFGYPVICDETIQNLDHIDLIIIPSLEGDLKKRLEQHEPFRKWILDQYERGADIASNCTGSFLLAATGLLDGKTATTHWAAASDFRRSFPQITLLDERLIIDHGRIVSSGGATTFLNLMIYLIEKYYGHELAVIVSKYLLIDMDKVPQTNYAIFSIQKYHKDKAIRKVQSLIETQYTEKMTVDDMAEAVALGKRTLLRRFKQATGNTPHEYLQRVRVEAAKKKLEGSQESIYQIGSEVGYDDMGSFRKVFKRHAGVSLREYRRKYEKMVG